ncbi:MAG: dihydrofolate reductase [Oscillatoriales cyanobacterium RU_3_3]|nr:dihydrofolate reductase [Oscillatoriales cyanobacterium RU_3_3]
MKTQYYIASSLDGFIADSQNSLDWLFQFGEEAGESYSQFIAEVGAIAMGSTTYEWILQHQIDDSADPARSWPYKQPAWVFSSRVLPIIEGANINYVKGDVLPIHQAMVQAAGNKNIWIVGGGDLAGQFYDRGLLDEIIVSIASVTLGSGAPLLPRPIKTPPLKLLSATTYGTDFVELCYQVSPPSRSISNG